MRRRRARRRRRLQWLWWRRHRVCGGGRRIHSIGCRGVGATPFRLDGRRADFRAKVAALMGPIEHMGRPRADRCRRRGIVVGRGWRRRPCECSVCRVRDRGVAGGWQRRLRLGRRRRGLHVQGRLAHGGRLGVVSHAPRTRSRPARWLVSARHGHGRRGVGEMLGSRLGLPSGAQGPWVQGRRGGIAGGRCWRRHAWRRGRAHGLSVSGRGDCR